MIADPGSQIRYCTVRYYFYCLVQFCRHLQYTWYGKFDSLTIPLKYIRKVMSIIIEKNYDTVLCGKNTRIRLTKVGPQRCASLKHRVNSIIRNAYEIMPFTSCCRDENLRSATLQRKILLNIVALIEVGISIKPYNITQHYFEKQNLI